MSWGNQPKRLDTESKIIDAIVDMPRRPLSYITRYTKLTGPQRVIFRALGPTMGLPCQIGKWPVRPFSNTVPRYCAMLVDWVKLFPEAILRATELTESERAIIKMVKGPIPPQLPYLADALVEIFRPDVAAAG